MARGPRCFRCLMLMLSGPVELLFFAFLMACVTCSSVMLMGVVFSFLMYRCSFLLVLLVLCMTVFVYCLLKYCAFWCPVIAVCCPKVIVVLWYVACFLFDSEAIVLYSL